MLESSNNFQRLHGISFAEAMTKARPALVKLSTKDRCLAQEFNILNLDDEKFFLYQGSSLYGVRPAVCQVRHIEFVAYLDAPHDFEGAIAAQMHDRKHSDTVAESLHYLEAQTHCRYIDRHHVIWEAQVYKDGFMLRSSNTSAVLFYDACEIISLPGLLPYRDRDCIGSKYNFKNAQDLIKKTGAQAGSYYEDAWGVHWILVKDPTNVMALKQIYGTACIYWDTLKVIEIIGLGLISTTQQRKERKKEFYAN